MILIYPPAAKPCEPPAGIAKLAGHLLRNGAACKVWDANLEGMLFLMGRPAKAFDTWTGRAMRNFESNLASLRAMPLYKKPDRYGRAVRDLQRLLGVSGTAKGAVPGLADYKHRFLSPLRSSDLIRAAATPESNPFYPSFRQRFPDLLEKDGSGVVGISLNYLSQALCAFAMAGYIKKDFPAVKIVLGGGLVTSWLKKRDWINPFRGLVDSLIPGPGEQPLLDFLGLPRAKSEGAPYYGFLPLPDYLSPGLILPYSASSGCYWNRCSFCPERAEQNPYRPVPVKRAVAELQALVAERQPVLVHMLDNAISPAMLRGLSADPPGAPWYGFARIGRELADEDFCRLLRKSGCVMLQLGLESGNQAVLDNMQKGIDLETASRTLRNLKKAGIGVYLYLMFGTPSETQAAARNTRDFVVRHGAGIDFMNVALFNMPLEGPEAGVYETRGFYEGDLSLYTDFRHPHGWGRKAVRLFLEREFRRDPSLTPILKRTPPYFTSNHAPFFCRGCPTEIAG